MSTLVSAGGFCVFLLLGDDALHDLGSFTNAVAEVIQLSPANLAVTHYFDAADTGAMIGESALYAYAVGYAANGEGLADTAALHFNHDAFEVLKTFAVAFHDLNEYADGVTDFQLGQVGTELFFFQFFNDVGHFILLPTGVLTRLSAAIGPTVVTNESIITRHLPFCKVFMPVYLDFLRIAGIFFPFCRVFFRL